MKTDLLSFAVNVSGRYHRSTNISYAIDDSEKILADYIVSPTIKDVFVTMATQYKTGTNTFIWTGNYGTGKSSAALLLSKLLCGVKNSHKHAKQVLNNDYVYSQIKSMRLNNKKRFIIPVVAQSNDPMKDILDQLVRMQLIKPRKANYVKNNFNKFAEALVSIEQNINPCKGVFLVFDEMGKYLEQNNRSIDVGFWQDLAELSMYNKNKFLILGILHKSITNYSGNMSIEQVKEWNKVVGRYSDISINLSVEEQIYLISKSIIVNDTFPKKIIRKRNHSHNLYKYIKTKNNDTRMLESLANTWPLHPITSLIIAEGLCNATFTQAQRTLFGFMLSGDPWGFRKFISQHYMDEVYEPWMLWDYIYCNFNLLLNNVEDSQRWVTSKMMVNKVESFSNADTLKIAKFIAVCFLLKIKSVQVNDKLLKMVFCIDQSKIKNSIDTLIKNSCIIYRNHEGAYQPYAGSDFNIDQETKPIKKLTRFNQLDDSLILNSINKRVVARRHLFNTGALRFMKVVLANKKCLSNIVKEPSLSKKYDGYLFLLVTNNDLRFRSAHRPDKDYVFDNTLPDGRPYVTTYIGLSHPFFKSIEEYATYKTLSLDQRLQNDAIARHEVIDRLIYCKLKLENELINIVNNSVWIWKNKKIILGNKITISMLVSDIMDDTYYNGVCINNELLNSNMISSSAKSAAKLLMKRMITHGNQARLGITDYPAHGAMYDNILYKTGLHKTKKDFSYYQSPNKNDKSNLWPIWNETKSYLRKKKGHLVVLQSIILLWQSPPYGIKSGLIPVLLLAFYLINQRSIAFYLDGVFRTKLEDIDIERLLQLDKGISFRYIVNSKTKLRFISQLSNAIAVSPCNNHTLLDVGRKLVTYIDGLHPWTKRTSLVSDNAATFRNILIRASDPYQFIMRDLFDFFMKTTNAKSKQQMKIEKMLSEIINELTTFHTNRLSELEYHLVLQLGNEVEGVRLRDRAAIVADETGDLRCKAFAQRLANSETVSQAIMPIASLAINKPVENWNDLDYKQCRHEISVLSQQFIEIEMNKTLSSAKDYNSGYYIRFDLLKTGGFSKKKVAVTTLKPEQIPKLTGLVHDLSKLTENCERQVFFAALAEFFLSEKNQ